MKTLPVMDQSHCAQIRREATNLALSLGFDETETGKVAIVASEAATNLLKHAGNGEMLLRPLSEESRLGLEIVALDRGPGMENVRRCLEDGFSTAGSPGTGLGAMARLASLFDLYSIPGKGTVVLLRFFTARGPKGQDLDLGVVCLPKPEETVSGDDWAVDLTSRRRRILLVDGLGHGVLAGAAAAKAVRAFREHASYGPAETLESIHGELRATRGAAVAVAEVDCQKGIITFAGVGNIAGFIASPGRKDRSMVSHNGIVGQPPIRVQEFSYPCPEDARLVFHSDGLSSRFSLEEYPGLLSHHPGIIAGVLYRDFRRTSDDVTVLVHCLQTVKKAA